MRLTWGLFAIFNAPIRLQSLIGSAGRELAPYDTH